MEIFHVVFDTSLLRRTPFGKANFERLLRRVQQGVLKLYIPYIALEERRTQLLDEHLQLTAQLRSKFDELQSGQLAMLIEGLPKPELLFPNKEEVQLVASFLEVEIICQAA